MSCKSALCSRVSLALLLCMCSGSLLVLPGCGGLPVDVVSPRKGEIRESFTEPARTRLDTKYPISMPVDGRIGRIKLKPKDPVKKNELLAHYDLVPFKQSVKEARSKVAELKAEIVVKDDNRLEGTALVEAKSAIDAATEALKASKEQVAAERARWKRQDKELRRMTKLLSGQAIPQSKMDDVNLAAETALIDLKQQQFYLAAMKAIVLAVNLGPVYVNRYLDRKKLERHVLVQQLSQAQARLVLAEHDLKLTAVRSPIDGIVLEKYQQGDRTLSAGTQLLLIGNLKELEVVADVLTQDALRIRTGSDVKLEPSVGSKAIPGKVKRIEPAGFTKLSSLGVEQQRVKVIVSLGDEPRGLGVGYRVQARFYVGSKSDALIVSRSSVMQAPDGTYYVLKVDGGKLKKQPVKLGLRSDLELEILSGLTDKDLIVARPDTTLEEGMRVDPIKASKAGD
jgi:HlyD family secretion protein